MNWKKRIVSLVLAAVIGVGTFLSSGVEAEAAGVIGKGDRCIQIPGGLLTGVQWRQMATALHL